jgi:hypothetical protein
LLKARAFLKKILKPFSLKVQQLTNKVGAISFAKTFQMKNILQSWSSWTAQACAPLCDLHGARARTQNNC